MFGIMFVPDKAVAFVEAARVLQPGGIFVFSVWDGLSASPAAAAADQLLRETFPLNPPTYYEVPYGFNDRAKIKSMLETAGFSSIHIEPHTLPSQSPSALALANGIIRGSPVAIALQQRQAEPEAIVSALRDRLAAFAGVAPCISTTRALIVSARRAET
jgi:SAM-dependent methyltransferase